MADRVQTARTFEDNTTCEADLYVQQEILAGAVSSPFGGEIQALDDGATALNVISYDASGAPAWQTVRGRGTQSSPSAVQSGDVIGNFAGYGYYDTSNVTLGLLLSFKANENWSGTNKGSRMEFYTISDAATSTTLRATIHEGLQMGSPTGGDKGAGTINTAADIYQNNTAYTNPDWLFERHFTGTIELYAENYSDFRQGGGLDPGELTIDEMYDRVCDDLRFPFISDEPMGAFARSNAALAITEQLFLYIHQLHERIRELEER